RRAARRRAAEAAGSSHVAVGTIAKIYGTSFGLPHPGLLPTKDELDERRGWGNGAIRKLEAAGTAADGRVAGTRATGKKLAAIARARRPAVVVIDETTVRRGV